jgi:hypothetical protein
MMIHVLLILFVYFVLSPRGAYFRSWTQKPFSDEYCGEYKDR